MPIDQCYALVGLIKSRWEGISGGSAIEEAVPRFFASIRARAARRHGDRRMSAHAESRDPPLLAPEPEFEITGAAHIAFAAAPTMLFSASAADRSGHEIQSIALTVQVMIDPAKRGYDPETRARLAELFGPPASWAPSTSGLAWARVSTAVPGFTGATPFGIEVPVHVRPRGRGRQVLLRRSRSERCRSASTSTATSSSTVPADRLQVVPVPWSCTAQYRLPVAAWRAMIAEHYPGGGWIRVDERTLEALNDRRGARGLPTFDACIAELLEVADEHDA